jgi:hypothetical protein
MALFAWQFVAGVRLVNADEAEAATPAATLPPVTERYATEDVTEEPSFQRHVSPLFGRLGCNGRACHGSFQGRGDFRLSLFGYDFKADHDELLKGDPIRANKDAPLDSLILVKPTDEDMHEGGKRYEKGGWEYHVFRRWLEAGAKFEEDKVEKLTALEITPAEILFSAPGETVALKAVAVWPDGTREDVTSLCRFTTNSEQVAKITADGLVTATEPGDTHVVIAYDNAVVPVQVIRPVSQLSGDQYPLAATPTKIDELVVAKLKKLGVVQSEICTDAEFLRRVSLDLTGTLPSAADVEQFLNDPSATKRADKIEQLMQTPAYVAWWTTRLCDWTGNNDQKLNNVGPRGLATQQWYDWIYARVEKNEPYDKIVEGVVLASSREPGESYTDYCETMSNIAKEGSDAKFADRQSMPYYWARNNFRTAEDRAIGFAYTFLGIRIQCAQCHKHPFDQWSKADFDAFKNFFPGVQLMANGPRDKETREQYDKMLADLGLDDTELKGNQLRNKLSALLKEGKTIPFPEIVANPVREQNANRRKGKQQAAPQFTARVLGGEGLDLAGQPDARAPLMDWLRQKDNPYFAKSIVNRVWANYFNVGIVQPPDDLSLANPPSNRALLDHLAEGFVANAYDLKWLHREIANSRTYQLSWQPNETNAKDERNFARAVPRRIAAEVAVDALTTAVASDEKAQAMLTEMNGRSIFLAGSNARSPGGNRGDNSRNYALQVFGRSIRESNCDCDRSMDSSLLQTVFLQNDTFMLQALEGGGDSWLAQISKRSADRLSDGSDTERIDFDREISRTKAKLKRAKNDKDKNDKDKDAKDKDAEKDAEDKDAEDKDADKQVQRLEDKLAELEQAKAEKEAAKKLPARLNIDEPTLVRQVYLRTLSRLPTPEEMDRCLSYLAESESPLDGAKGLLWTLINTKEFIVNH